MAAVSGEKPNHIEATDRSSMTTTTGPAHRPIDRTPDEDEFQMTLIPETKIIFRSDKIATDPITTTLIMHNDTPYRQAFKVKCTSNSIFRIKPASGFIKPNEKKEIVLTYRCKDVPKDNLHFFSFYHLHCDDPRAKPRPLFEKYRPEGVKRIQAQFKYADGKSVHPADSKSDPEKSSITGPNGDQGVGGGIPPRPREGEGKRA